MTSDKPEKGKKIEDALSSIDSLLDTATDIQTNDANQKQDDGASVKPVKKSTRQPAKVKQVVKSKFNSPAPSRRKKMPGTAKAAVPGGQSSNKKKTETGKAARPPAAKVRSQAETGPPEHVAKDQKKSRPAAQAKSQTQQAQPGSAKRSQSHATGLDDDRKQAPSSSLSFTTVDDDLSHSKRELPVLEDVVTAEELALIGSGKELPKKVLTQAFKRRSLTDKLIQILEKQLSDYNISKLEYKYLRKLFDELLDQEKNRR